MLPKRLTIQGLYSYQEKQIIDFSVLTDAGIFGIFGAVGSGKSSILEAIGFALYGKTDRLNERENRNYNMMNLKSSELLIDFEFEHYDHSLYRFTVKGKRNSKRFEEVKALERSAYKLVNDEWIPLESSDATNLLDLSYDNFKRTVIIPQGKFQEFLQLGSKERTGMMMEIFHLHKYDLSGKVSILEKENDLQIAQLEGELKSLVNSSEEDLEEKKEVLKTLQRQEKEKKTELEKKEKEFQELSKLKEHFDQLKKHQQEFALLESEKPSFEEKRKNIETYEQAKLYFEPSLRRKENLQKSLTIRDYNINNDNIKLEKLNQDLTTQTISWNKIKQDYESLEDWRTQIQDYQNILEILTYKKQADTLENKIDSDKKNITISQKQKQQITESISFLETNLNKIKAEQPSNIFVFNEVGEWFQQKNIFEKQIKERQQQINVLKERIEKGKAIFQTLSFSYENWRTEYETRKKQYNDQINIFQNKKIELSTKAELHQYAQTLAEGTPCPLCGATHHPNILDDDKNIKIEIQQLDKDIANTTKLLIELDSNSAKANQYSASILSFEEQVNQLSQNINDIEQVLKIHKENFSWKDFDSNNESDFILKKQNADANISEIAKIEKEFSVLQKQLDNSRDELSKIQNILTNTEAQHRAILDNIENYLNKLNIISRENVFQHSTEVISHSKKELEDKSVFTKSQYEIVQKNIQELDKQKTIIESTIQSLLTEKEKESIELQSIIEQINKLLVTHKINNEDIIENILKQIIDLAQEKQVLQEYQNKLFSVQQNLLQIQSSLAGKDFEESEWNVLNEEIKNDKTTLSHYTASIAQQTQTIELLTQTLLDKKRLQDHLHLKTIRKTNIQTLKNLFMGNGFVNFISSVYLKNLCIAANDRFSKLTNNQLHLELSDNNEFLIRDFLNEGKTRSTKTLSGGQIFQASLSLALALADSVQYQNKSEQNFFFLDEGFGSLDKGALTTVYDTLKSLRKENRIIGIISHVEDLQQEIPVSLLVKNDIEKGSQIELILS